MKDFLEMTPLSTLDSPLLVDTPVGLDMPCSQDSALQAAKQRRTILLGALRLAEDNKTAVQVTVFGYFEDQGAAPFRVLAYAQVHSKKELAQFLVQRVGPAMRLCDAVVGHVSYKALLENPRNEAWAGLGEFWHLLKSAESDALTQFEANL